MSEKRHIDPITDTGYDDEEVIDVENTVIKPICTALGIEHDFVGVDNDALTWDIAYETSWIKYHPSYGYYLCVNHIEDDGTCTELVSHVLKEKHDFIAQTCCEIERRLTAEMTIAKS